MVITFDHVTKRFTDGTVAVDDLQLDIKQGEFFVFIGPSGSGKTTTLKMINQLVTQSEGSIFINDKKNSDYNIYELRWNIGYVLQQIALFPHMTIEENITIVPELKKWSKAKMKRRAYELLEMVGLDPKAYAQRKPNQLSGGEQQRVGVIRALATDSDIILMDEPFSALDPISREKLQDDMLDLMKQLNKTTVFVTHDMQEALKLADRICIMKDGKVVQVGTPKELIYDPINQFVKHFVGGNSQHQQGDFVLEDILLPMMDEDFGNMPTVSSSVTFDEVLDKLSDVPQIAVLKHNEPIGYITRQKVIQYLATRPQGSVMTDA